MFDYIRDPAEIYRQSFAAIRAEADLSPFPADVAEVVVRIIHACGQVEAAQHIAWGGPIVQAATQALQDGKPILCDARMVAKGIITRALPAENPVRCFLDEPNLRDKAAEIGNTLSAACVDLWAPEMDGAIVAIGNAPTALFRLLELLAEGAPKPAAILGFPVGFIGAAESKEALIEHAGDIPFITVRGRLGGSAMASAAVNGLTKGAKP